MRWRRAARLWSAGLVASVGTSGAVLAALLVHPLWWAVAGLLYAATLILLPLGIRAVSSPRP